MPIYIATVYVRDPTGERMKPSIHVDEAESPEDFKALVRDWWITRYGVDSEPEFGPVGLSKRQTRGT